jgi:integrase
VEDGLKAKVREKGIGFLTVDPPILSKFAIEFLEWVKETNSIESDTKRYYQNGLRLLKGTKLAGLRMDTITNHDCETITFPGGAATANTALRTLRRMFTKAKEMKQVYETPEIALRKEWGRSVAMNETSAEKIAAKMSGDPQDAFRVLRCTGMRPKEVFSMRWEFFLWDKFIYQNARGKTTAARRPVPLLEDSIDVLRRRVTEQGGPLEGWVFPSSKSSNGHLMTISKAFTKARDAAGLPKEMVLYTARHGVGTDLASHFSLKTVMETLGHTDAKTALRYQHPDVLRMREELAALKTNGRVM